MGLDHSLVGEPSEPHLRSWDSKDALLYAVGVGAGLGDPLAELEFTTENSEGVTQQVLPTYGVLLAQAPVTRSLGDFDRAMLVHGGIGYSRHKPFEHIYRHHRRYRITEGSEEIQMRKVGAFLFGYLGPKRKAITNIGWEAGDYREEGQIRTNVGF